MNDTFLKIVVEYIWVPVVTGLFMLWGKATGLNTRASLLEQACIAGANQRMEDKKWRDEQRKEIMTRIDRHHEIVMRKLETLEAKVKNGH